MTARIASFTAAIGACGVLGLNKLAYPLMDDQAQFLLGAKTIAAGGVLYRDFWDIKPPGIFLFYLAGGSLFGFDAVGIHAFELVYMLLLAATIGVVLQRPLGTRTAALAAIFSVGAYYLMANEWWLTDLEPLINFPILLVLISLVRAVEDERLRLLWLLLAGLASGFVVLFKPVLFLVPLSLWLAIVAPHGRMRRAPVTWLLLAVGASVPAVLVLLWFGIHGAILPLLQTVFVIPMEVAQQIDPWRRLHILLVGIRWYTEKAAPFILLAAIGTVVIWRSGMLRASGESMRERTCWVRGVFTWAAAGAVAILLQVTAWWDYHWLLLLCPVGILGAVAGDRLLSCATHAIGHARLLSIAVILVTLGLGMPLIGELPPNIESLDQRIAAIHPSARAAYQASVSPRYRSLEAESTFLSRPDSLGGSILVWGSPLIYLMSGRRPASTVQASDVDWFTPALIARQATDLERERPAYIFLARAPHEPIVLRVPRFRELLHDHYTVVHTSNVGTWYRRAAGAVGEARQDPLDIHATHPPSS